MPKLNQILAIEKGTKNRAYERLSEVYKTLQKAQLFNGHVKTWQPREENTESDAYELLADEKHHVQQKVSDLLRVVREAQSELVDISFMRDLANCSAKANVVIDGKPLLQDMPATHLLWLEKQLSDLHAEIKKVPTLDPAEKWAWDSDQNLYVSEPSEQRRTKKVQRPLVLHPATKEHPAQVQLVTDDVATGTWKTKKFSAAMPVDRRDEMLARVERLQKAVKQAREEANMVELPKQHEKIGDKIFDFVLDGRI
jgi:hypothetical protein